MTRAQAEAVVDMLNSRTMDFSDPGKQRERLITLAEAALAEHAKAAVSDVGALVERLRERAASYRLGGPSSEHTASLLDEAAAALLSAQEEAAGLREKLGEALDGWSDAAQYKGNYLAEKHGDFEEIAALRAFLTSIKETGDAR